MNLDEILCRLIIEIEKEKYEQEIEDIQKCLSIFSKVGNIKQMDLTYKRLRDCAVSHRKLISILHNNGKISNEKN